MRAPALVLSNVGDTVSLDALNGQRDALFRGVLPLPQISLAAGRRAALARSARTPGGQNACRSDSFIGSHLHHAGFVTVGTTATCELGWGPAASRMGFDAVSNPWDLERSPGGSSN